MSQVIYLIGQISSAAPESYEWRQRVREYFNNKEDNVCRSKNTIIENAALMPSYDPFDLDKDHRIDNTLELPMMVVTASEKGWEIIDPCHNAFNASVKKESTSREAVYETAGVDLIVPKDRMAVKRSSICFANFHRYDPKKALIGTMFELAWYADSPDKAVIGIFDGDHMKDEYCRHPFVRSAVHTWVTDEIEACELAERYFTD